MSKRTKELEKEALEQGLTPTKELEIDETMLSEEEKPHYSIPWASIIIIGVLSLIVIGLTVALIIMGNS